MQVNQQRTFRLWMTAALCAGGLVSALWVSGSPAVAQSEEADILRQEAVLQPSFGVHTFTGEAGQAITITLTSEDFDTVLVLLDPDGLEIGYNDDFGSSLNSTITRTLPVDGEYTIQARSFGGTASGDYTLTVRVATPYEAAFAEGYDLYLQGDYEGAIAAYDRAIEIDPDQAQTFLSRADAYYGLAQQLTPEERALILENYRRALEIYEANGDEVSAQMLRDQILYLEEPPQPGFGF